MDREHVKKMICEAIDNIPQCAEITDCYTDHSFADWEAYLKVKIEVKERTDDNQLEFHNIAHKAFNTDMDFVS